MKHTNKHLDTLIIGQGLAGSMLAWSLMQQGKKVLIVGDETGPSASRVAAGLFNPVTGQRLVLQKNAAAIIPAARDFYRQLESHFDQQFFHPKPMLRILNNDKACKALGKRKGDPAYTPYLGEQLETASQIKATHGLFEQLQTGYLDTNALLDCLQTYFMAQGCYLAQRFDDNDLSFTERGIAWRGFHANTIIFCEGFMAKDNPWFHWLPFQPAKGEILTLKSAAELPDQIINGGHWLLPVHDGSYKTGASYDHDLSNLEPTEQARTELFDGLQQLLSIPLSCDVINQQAGVRPNTLDKNPFIGFHPQHKQLGIFNGFGSKGSMLIPFYCNAFVDYLTGNAPLPAEADIARIKRPRLSLTQQVHNALRPHIKVGSIAIDATAGNGFDTLFLANHVGANGQVFAFDIQQQAITNTQQKLEKACLQDRAILIRSGHELMAKHIPSELHGKVNTIMFNLGYLPRADKSVITKTSTTLNALDSSIHLLAPTGRISILAYPGHAGGREETESIKLWAGKLSGKLFNVIIHESKYKTEASPEWIEIIKF